MQDKKRQNLFDHASDTRPRPGSAEPFDVEDILMEARRRRAAQGRPDASGPVPPVLPVPPVRPAAPVRPASPPPAQDSSARVRATPAPAAPVRTESAALPTLRADFSARKPAPVDELPAVSEPMRPAPVKAPAAPVNHREAGFHSADSAPLAAPAEIKPPGFSGQAVPRKTAGDFTPPAGSTVSRADPGKPEDRPRAAPQPQNPASFSRFTPARDGSAPVSPHSPAQDNPAPHTVLKSIDEMINNGEPLLGGIRQWGRSSRHAPHALTPEEVLGASQNPRSGGYPGRGGAGFAPRYHPNTAAAPSPDKAPVRAGEAPLQSGPRPATAPVPPVRPLETASIPPVRQLATAPASSVRQSATAPASPVRPLETAPASPVRQPEKTGQERAAHVPAVNPFLLNRNMYDKTLHLEPVEQTASCRIFKTPSGEETCIPEESAPVVSPPAAGTAAGPAPGAAAGTETPGAWEHARKPAVSQGAAGAGASLRYSAPANPAEPEERSSFSRYSEQSPGADSSAPSQASQAPRAPRADSPEAPLPRIRTGYVPPAAPPAAGGAYDAVEMHPAGYDLGARKREAFEEAKKPDRSYHLPQEDEPRFHSTAQAEPAAPEPMDSFYITSPVDLSRELSPEQDFLSRPLRDAKRAKAKIRLFDMDEDENLPEETPIFPDDDAEIIDDFDNMEDAPLIRGDLAARKAKMWMKTVLSGIFFGVLALAAVLPALGVPVPMISGDENAAPYLIFHAAVLLLGCIVNFSAMRGLSSLVKLKPDFDSPVALACVAALFHTVFLLIQPSRMVEAGVPSFAAAAMLGFFLSDIGKLYMMTRITENFEEAATLQRKSAAFILPDDQLAMDAAEGVTLGAPYVCCTRETGHLRHFLYHSFCEDPADILCARLAPVSLLAAAVACGAALILGQTLAVALTAVCAVLCLFMPAVCLVAGHVQMFSASRRVAEEGGLLSGFDAVNEFCYTSSLAVDARDLFSEDRVVLHSIRTFGNLAIDQAIMDCSSVAIVGGSPLSDLFDKVIEGQRDILPKVKSLDYEDGCGISGVVSDRQILVGNRELCVRHGISDLPDAGFEDKILRSGKFPVYLCSGGELAAMFIVAYEADPEIAGELNRLTDSGVSLLVSTSDPNVSDRMVCRYFGLPAEAVRVLPADVSARLHQKTRATRSEPALLSHKNSLSALAVGIRACVRLRGNFRFIVVAQIAFIFLGLMVGLYSLVSHSALWMSVPFMLILQAGALILTQAALLLRKP